MATRVVYTAESRVRDFRAVVRDMVQGLRHSFYVGYRLCRKDIKAEHNRSAFGIFWDFADPLMMGIVFYFLMKWRVFDAGLIGMPYPLFVIYGLFLYATFTQGITQSLNVLRNSKTIMDHLKVPPEALIMSVFYRVMFDSAFRLVIMLAFSVGYVFLTADAEGGFAAGFSVSADGAAESLFHPLGFCAFIAAYPILAIFGIGVGILLAPFNAVYLDVGRFVRIVLMPLRYVSNTLFLLPSGTWLFAHLHAVNPVASFIDGMRGLATGGTIVDPIAFAIWSIVFAVIFVAGWLVFHLSIPILAERA